MTIPPAPRRFAGYFPATHRFGGNRYTENHGAQSRIVTGFAWCNCRTAMAAADVVQIPQGHTDAPEPEEAAGRCRDHQDLSFRAVRYYRALQRLWRDAAADLLHQDCLKAFAAPTPTDMVLKDLVREVLGIDLSKQQQSSDWGFAIPERRPTGLCGLGRAASARPCASGSTPCLRAENRTGPWRRPVSSFLPTRAKLDLSGWENEDIFAHFLTVTGRNAV